MVVCLCETQKKFVVVVILCVKYMGNKYTTSLNEMKITSGLFMFCAEHVAIGGPSFIYATGTSRSGPPKWDRNC